MTDIHHADVIVIGFGSAGACAAIEAHDSKAEVILLEKQPQESHYSSTRMSGGGYHSPSANGNFEALKAYSKAMFSGDNLPYNLEGTQPEFADELAELWARHSPQNEPFMRSLDPLYNTVSIANAAFTDFPGAAESGYAVVKSTYTGSEDEAVLNANTKDAPKTQKQSGEAFHACLLTGLQSRRKGGLRANAQRQVVDWDDKPIPRLYTAGEIASVFQFVYQGGGNLAEGITFGRLAGRNAAAERPWTEAQAQPAVRAHIGERR